MQTAEASQSGDWKDYEFHVMQIRAVLEDEEVDTRDVLDIFANFNEGIDLDDFDSMDDDISSYERWNKQLKHILLQKQASRCVLELDDPWGETVMDESRLKEEQKKGKETLAEAKAISRQLQVSFKAQVRLLEDAIHQLLERHGESKRIEEDIQQTREWQTKLQRKRDQLIAREKELVALRQQVAKVQQQLRAEKTMTGQGVKHISADIIDQYSRWMQ